MRRLLAPVLAAALAALPTPGRAEPLDLDLAQLGAPDPAVWEAIIRRTRGLAADAPLSPDELAFAASAASAAKQRFALLSSEMALALSSAILQPAATTGHSGFEFSLETAYVGVHPTTVSNGTVPASVAGQPGFVAARDNWPASMKPSDLTVPAFHVRKALPFSFELGGRVIYLSQSSYFAGQVEAKWALNEGFEYVPDVALRGAWTQLFGQRDWSLGTGDVDLMVSRRWGVNGVTSFTPYAALRFTFVNASTDVMDFWPVEGAAPSVAGTQTQAAFPTLHAAYYRTTAGLRFTAYAVSLAGEVTYFGGSTQHGKDNPSAGEYPDFKVASSWGGAFHLGFQF